MSKVTPVQISNPYKFSAYRSGAQSITANTNTKIQFNVERFDTNSDYDHVTNFRYTAPVTGYYWVNAEVQCIIAVAANVNSSLRIYVNGSIYRKGNNIVGVTYPQLSVTSLVYLTAGQYVEIFFHNTAAADSIESSSSSSTFEAFLVSTI